MAPDTSVIYQQVPVALTTTSRAFAFVHAVKLYGKGFGKTPGESAGLRLQELAADGRLVVEHSKLEVTKAYDYIKLTRTFTTSPQTVAPRFLHDTVIGCCYDDCPLVEVA
ncbi:MAG: hypothetical protein ACUVX8_01155 [Candidatus Zipacnadales bacterium]